MDSQIPDLTGVPLAQAADPTLLARLLPASTLPAAAFSSAI